MRTEIHHVIQFTMLKVGDVIVVGGGLCIGYEERGSIFLIRGFVDCCHSLKTRIGSKDFYL